jgi:hypothetical protein
MANWSAYKESEIGLPVVKRALHGIHFDKGKGLVQAEFVGKPCHYFDGKEYRAIDTKPLLRKDGSYGCPHSDVIIKPDGTVQVGTYYQKAALILPGKMSVDGDRIARPFSGGVQYLYITEDGYRQEIVLEKMPDLKKVSALLDTVSGVLPSKYTASGLSLKDADGLDFTADKTSLASVLEAAKYPLVIDPDFGTINGVGADVWINNANPTYNYGIYIYCKSKALLRFDLSSIDSSDICTDADLYMTPAENNTGSVVNNIYKVSDANGDWIEGTKNGAAAGSGEPCWNAKEADGSGGVTTAWAGSAGLSTAGTDYENTSLATYTGAYAAGTAIELPFNESGLTVLQSWFGEVTNNGLLFVNNGNQYIGMGENGTAARRPVLSVTYTAAASGNPYYYFRQQ